ncbi:MAG: hypothetical protein QNL04_06330 [SAR324 cluster bacterium]|nr:hypothetical protein [SAR324 cluster bacterium]
MMNMQARQGKTPRESVIQPKTQAFNHQLHQSRDWDQALDVIHWILAKKWYFTAIATNNKKGTGGRLSNQLFIQRKCNAVTEEIEALFKIQLNGILQKANKVDKFRINERDVWHLTSTLEEFPKGTKIIEIHQLALSSLIKSTKSKKSAFVILDGKASAMEVNTVMKFVHKLITDKNYCTRLSKEVAIQKKVQKKPAEPKKALNYKDARSPGGLLLTLMDEPVQVRGVSAAEYDLLKDYMAELKSLGHFQDIHEKVQRLLKTHFQHKAMAAAEGSPVSNQASAVDLFSQV